MNDLEIFITIKKLFPRLTYLYNKLKSKGHIIKKGGKNIDNKGIYYKPLKFSEVIYIKWPWGCNKSA